MCAPRGGRCETGDELGAWDAWDVGRAAAVLDPTGVPWWVAGGWAVELFLGRRTRPQEDVDVGLWREDVPRLTSALPAWEFAEARGGALTPVAPGAGIAEGAHILWGRPRADGVALWSVEVLVEDRAGDVWTYRRDRRVTRPAAGLTWRAGAVRAIAPEVQLLYKSKDVRPKDQADFDAVAPRLGPAARAWLAGALGVVSPGHPWGAALA